MILAGFVLREGLCSKSYRLLYTALPHLAWHPGAALVSLINLELSLAKKLVQAVGQGTNSPEERIRRFKHDYLWRGQLWAMVSAFL